MNTEYGKGDRAQVSLEQLSSYVAGQADVSELAAIEEALARDPALSQLASSMRSVGVTVAQTPGEWSVETGWTAVAARLQSSGTYAGQVSSARRPIFRYLAWIPVVCVVGAAYGLYTLNTDSRTSSGGPTKYATKAGERANLTLRNGSRVVLGPVTTLLVREDGNVDVSGEALFTINHSSKEAFVVTAHGVTTRVLGTEFMVRAYDASGIRVAVREGKVSVQSPAVTVANAAIVTAGEVASVTQNGAPSVSEISDLATDFAWAEGELVLRDVPLGEAISRLSRWYNIKLQVADVSLLDARVSGVFPSSFSLSKMEDFAQIMEARAVMSGNTLTFYKH